MDELLVLLERYVPGYQRRIQGVYDWGLDELAESFGRPLPGFYREFALVMGEKGGPLLDHVHAYHPLKAADIYRLAPETQLPPRRFLYIFGDPSVDAQHYWLDLESPSEEEDCQVVRIPFGKEAWKTRISRVHVSLREMLFFWAMNHVRLPAFAQGAEYLVSASDPTARAALEAEDLARTFEKLGFTRLSYPQHCLLFDRDDAGIALYRPPDAPGFSFRVAMREPDEFRRFQAVVEDIQGIEAW